MRKEEVTGVVLAGGKSSRFGTNKALAVWSDETLLQHAINRLRPLCASLLISAEASNYPNIDERFIADILPERGPLGGIYSVLRQVDTPYVLCLTCDMPLIGDEVLNQLLNAANGEEALCYMQGNGMTEPFPLLIKTDVAPIIESCLKEERRSLQSLFKSCISRRIPLSDAQLPQFYNINHHADLLRLMANDTDYSLLKSRNR